MARHSTAEIFGDLKDNLTRCEPEDIEDSIDSGHKSLRIKKIILYQMDPPMDWQIQKQDLSSRFKELFVHNQWTDCAFRVGDVHTEVFKGHKIVLAASSPVFEALFYGTLADKKEFVEVPDLEPDTFRLLLKYMYCDSTDLTSIDAAGHLLYAAKKYMIPHLIKVCQDFILENTHINTLWEVLAVAEDLHEDELLASCIRVMCQYPGEMWVSNSEHVGLVTLNRLLDQPSTNLQEVELWQLITAWATDQCQLRDLTPTASNQRALINQAGILSKVRFLTFSPKELTEIVEPSGLLSDEEIRALRSSLTVLNTNKLISSNATTIMPEGISLPTGFNSTREMRKRFMAVPSRCFRCCLTKRKKYSYGGTLRSKISADSRVLVTGFEVFTRIATTVDYIMSHGSADHYLEDLVMTVSDEEGNILNRTEVSGLSSVYNVTQVVKLSEPVWFLPQHKYTVVFKLANGQYPLSDLSPIAYSKAVCFRFSHSEQIEDSTSDDLDVSFINGIFFSV